MFADGVDQNCDGGETCWADSDGDGYLVTASSIVASAKRWLRRRLSGEEAAATRVSAIIRAVYDRAVYDQPSTLSTSDRPAIVGSVEVLLWLR